jgi:hypothetical protein
MTLCLLLLKSTKPTYTNQEPTPAYGRQSSVMASRRWFDQPLGDQNLRPVHDGQYGLIAGSSPAQIKANVEMHDHEFEEPNTEVTRTETLIHATCTHVSSSICFLFLAKRRQQLHDLLMRPNGLIYIFILLL